MRGEVKCRPGKPVFDRAALPVRFLDKRRDDASDRDHLPGLVVLPLFPSHKLTRCGTSYRRPIGDVGGGVSDLIWQIYGATGYQFTDWFGLTVGYRYLGVDYDRDEFKLDIVTSGLLVGVEFRL